MQPPKRDRIQAFIPWEAELRKGSPYNCVRGTVSDLNKPLAAVAAAAHAAAEEFFDIVAVEERSSLLLVEPHDNFVWRTGPHGLKVQLTRLPERRLEFVTRRVLSSPNRLVDSAALELLQSFKGDQYRSDQPHLPR
jgi:hypothetical protein